VQAPEFEVSEDEAPDASGESKGILSIMTMIKERTKSRMVSRTRRELRQDRVNDSCLFKLPAP